MFDFLAHWFAKTEIINNGTGDGTKQPKWSYYKNGHFSLDLTFICIIVAIVVLNFVYQRYKKNNKANFLKMYELTNLRSQLDVERAPFGRAPQNCAVTQTGI
jgi:hypothetical protein